MSVLRLLPPLARKKPPRVKAKPTQTLEQLTRAVSLLSRRLQRLEDELVGIGSLIDHDSVMRAKGMLCSIEIASRGLSTIERVADELRQAQGYERSVDQRIERFQREFEARIQKLEKP